MTGVSSPGKSYSLSSSRTSSSTSSSSSGSSTMSHLVQEHHDVRHVHLARQQDVLARLRHRAVRRAHHQDRAVHLRRARDHVLHVVGVARAVHVRVVPLLRLVLHVRRRDRDPALRALPAPCRSGRTPRSRASPFFAWIFVIAAVSVVLPWSTCPIVPTFTCGLVRSNFALPIARSSDV